MEQLQVDLGPGKGVLEGRYEPDFAEVADEFVKNFRERDEVGAAVSLKHEGRTVVDLWGGMASRSAETPWTRDTVCVVFSCTKGAVAICAHMLASRGLLDIEAPVAEYWPEFAKNGKEKTTVRMMLDHSVGLPAWKTPLKANACLDWDYMVEALENEEPFWEPGTRNGYHMISFGWTVGELVRRVSGKSLGTFFREEVAAPLGIDFWIGSPPEVEERIAPVIQFVPPPGAEPAEFGQALLADRQSIQALSLFNNGGFQANSPECHAAEIGGGGGISNARGLAGMYEPFANGGALNGREFVDAAQLQCMGRISVATNRDATLLVPTRFALGFMKSMDNRRRVFGAKDSVVLSSAAFGHVGAGGSIGFADPVENLSFGYAMNRMGQGILLNERGQSLVDAAYRSLGYSSNETGDWVR